ncbi:MAG: DUF1801 domain-containing protein [Chloroflexota bacterium]
MAEGKTTKRTAKKADGFSAEERAAMRERARELKAGASAADGEAEVLAKIAAMPDSDRAMAERLHAVIKAAGPTLTPRTWYGMPAYSHDGQTLCFFQPRAQFKARYMTLGFSDKAHLDEGPMWATSFALMELTPEAEARITELVRRAVG